MIDNKLVQRIFEEARKEEIRRGVKISHIYVVGQQFFFDKKDVEGMEVDYTLVRSDMDPNFPAPELNTNKHLPEKPWDA